MRQLTAIIFHLLLLPVFLFGKTFDLTSPNGKVKVKIVVENNISYSIMLGNTQVLAPSPISLTLDSGQLGLVPNVKSTASKEVRDTIFPYVPIKRSRIPDCYNELSITFKGDYSLIFRAYDDGVAYRWSTHFPKEKIMVKAEQAAFVFADNATVWQPEIQKRQDADIFHTSFEEPYKTLKISEISPSAMAYNPVLVECANGVKAVLLESDLDDYPGMFIAKGEQGNSLKGVYAACPSATSISEGIFPQEIVTARHDYIALTKGSRSFPWRFIALSEKDGDLLLNDLVYRLAPPARPGDWSWLKPGISTEEWICSSNLYDVDFRAGLNTATYLFYVDFAAQFGLDYVMLDAGWSKDNSDILQITPGMSVDSIADYARQKGVSLTLWTLALALDRQLEPALTQFEKWGVRCIMTDFMDRNDQQMGNFYHRIAEACARHHIMVMFHGAFPPSGFERTWPHNIAREGAIGSEYYIWSEKTTPDHALTLPFIRMVSGSMDFEPGFLDNATKEQFRPIGMKSMSQGTRANQLAMFVAYESPMQMFSGNPSDGLREPEFMRFLGSIPTVWDETLVLDAKLGDYLLLARRHGQDWWVVGMNDWTPKDFSLPLDFLGEGSFTAEICADGINADRNAKDYQLYKKVVTKGEVLKLHLAPGGGWVARLGVGQK